MPLPDLPSLPNHFETQRLLIRAPSPGDGVVVNTAIVESFKELKAWMPWSQKLPSAQETEAFVQEAHARYLAREDLALLLLRKKDGYFVGASGLTRIDWSVPKFEIGYWCRTSLAGHGLISEAVKAITRFAFEELSARRVEIRVDDKNSKSWRVPERLGYALEGIARCDALDAAGGATRNTRVYSMISLGELTG